MLAYAAPNSQAARRTSQEKQAARLSLPLLPAPFLQNTMSSLRDLVTGSDTCMPSGEGGGPANAMGAFVNNLLGGPSKTQEQLREVRVSWGFECVGSSVLAVAFLLRICLCLCLRLHLCFRACSSVRVSHTSISGLAAVAGAAHRPANSVLHRHLCDLPTHVAYLCVCAHKIMAHSSAHHSYNVSRSILS